MLKFLEHILIKIVDYGDVIKVIKDRSKLVKNLKLESPIRMYQNITEGLQKSRASTTDINNFKTIYVTNLKKLCELMLESPLIIWKTEVPRIYRNIQQSNDCATQPSLRRKKFQWEFEYFTCKSHKDVWGDF